MYPRKENFSSHKILNIKVNTVNETDIPAKIHDQKSKFQSSRFFIIIMDRNLHSAQFTRPG